MYEIRSVEMLSGAAMVHIFIINANDNPPVFALNRYDVSVTEEQGKGALVGSITVHNIVNIAHSQKFSW